MVASVVAGLPYAQAYVDVRFKLATRVAPTYTPSVAVIPVPLAESGMTTRATSELAAPVVTQRTYCPVAVSSTARRPDDSPAMLFRTFASFTARLGPRMVPWVVPSSASYSVHGTFAPRSGGPPPSPPSGET